MKQNLGKIDRILRFALAFWWLGSWAPQFKFAWLSWVIYVVAWIALAESFFGWCWIHQVFKIHNKN